MLGPLPDRPGELLHWNGSTSMAATRSILESSARSNLQRRPGWANPENESFADSPTRPRRPALRSPCCLRQWAHYKWTVSQWRPGDPQRVHNRDGCDSRTVRPRDEPCTAGSTHLDDLDIGPVSHGLSDAGRTGRYGQVSVVMAMARRACSSVMVSLSYVRWGPESSPVEGFDVERRRRRLAVYAKSSLAPIALAPLTKGARRLAGNRQNPRRPRARKIITAKSTR